MSFSLSGLVHMLLLVILAIITLAAPPLPSVAELAARMSDDPTPDTTTFDDKPVELEQIEAFAGPPQVDPADFAGAVAAADNVAAVGVDTGVDAPLVTVGDLFSAGAKGMSA